MPSHTIAALLTCSVATAAALVTASCSGSKTAAAAEPDSVEVSRSGKSLAAATPVEYVRFRQGGCFGTCPVYTMTIAPGGAVRYEGKQYAPYKGPHLGTVPADTMAELIRLSETVLAKADQLPREIESGIVDHSYTYVEIATASDTLEFVGTTDFAQHVDTLRRMLMRLPDDVAFSPDPEAEAVPANRLRIRLQAADQVQVVQEEFYRQEMKVVSVEDPAMATFLVSFDPYTMSAEEMIEALGRMPQVVSVEAVPAGATDQAED